MADLRATFERRLQSVCIGIAVSVALAGGFGLFSNWQASASLMSRDATPAVTFGVGHIGRYQWGARVEAPEEAAERSEGSICLSIVFVEPTSRWTAEGNEVAQCSVLGPGTAMIESFTGGKRGKRRTALAMLFEGGATRAFIKLGGRSGFMVRLKKLSQESIKGISNRPLSAFARGFIGAPCLSRVIAYGEAGRVIARYDDQGCASHM